MPGILHHDLVLHDISRAIIDRDILEFLRDKFKEIRDDFEELPANWPDDDKVTLLVQRVEGLFIYAATVCRFIKSEGQWSPQDLLDLFIPSDIASHSLKWKHERPCTLPTRELDEIYTQIVKHPFKDVRDERDKERLVETFKQAIGSLAILSEPLSAAALVKLLPISQETIASFIPRLSS